MPCAPSFTVIEARGRDDAKMGEKGKKQQKERYKQPPKKAPAVRIEKYFLPFSLEAAGHSAAHSWCVPSYNKLNGPITRIPHLGFPAIPPRK